MKKVAFQGTAPALNALLGGQVDLMCDQTTQTTQHIRAGTVKFYGVTTKQRLRSMPDAPTLDESGLKDFEVVVWHGVYAPKGTPAAIIDKFGDARRCAINAPAFATGIAGPGAQQVAGTKTPHKGARTAHRHE